MRKLDRFGNLSAAFRGETEDEARAAALAWIAGESLIATWTLLCLWRPRADRIDWWRAEFDVTYKPRTRVPA